MEKNVNKATNILRAWHRVEFFQPYTIPESLNQDQNAKRIARWELESNYSEVLPWLDGNTRQHFGIGPQQHVNYHIYLATFDKALLKQLVDEKFEDFQDENERTEFSERLDSEGNTCFAKLRLDACGVPDFETMSVSTLPWALGKLAKGEVHDLNLKEFDKRCARLATHVNERLNSCLQPHPANSQLLVVTPRIIHHLITLLEQWAEFSLPVEQEFVIAIDWFEVPEKKSHFVASTGISTVVTQSRSETNSVDDALLKGALAANNDLKSNDLKEEIDQDDDNEEKDTCSERIMPIINSFFIEDIEKAINLLNSGQEHSPLTQYLSNCSSKYADLYSHEGLQLIRSKLAANKTPSGRWPSSPQNNMSLMQQFAINVAFDDLRNGGLLSINGPPGTGKTTLLRDIVAQNVVERANVLSSFEHPFDSIEKDGFPKDSLFGYEMVVASSNNAAVENISRELPLKSSIDNKTFDISFMEPVANQMFAPATKIKGKFKLSPMTNEQQCWGHIAAVLGSKKNRNNFLNRLFYYDHLPEGKLQLPPTENENYLKFWKWNNHSYTHINKTERSQAEDCQPPYDSAQRQSSVDQYSVDQDSVDQYSVKQSSGKQSSVNQGLGKQSSVKPFAIARKEFLQTRHELNVIQSELQEYLALKDELSESRLKARIEQLDVEINSNKQDLDKHTALLSDVHNDLSLVQEKIDVATYDLNVLEKPKLINRLFRSREYHSYIEGAQNYQLIIAEQKRAGIDYRTSKKSLELKVREFEGIYNSRINEKVRLESELATKCERFETLKLQFEHMPQPSDDDDISSNELQRNAYWQAPAINAVRSELFCKAMALHESWIVSVSQHALFKENVILNIGNTLSGRDVKHVDKVFKSLFLLVPVVSTTFASIGSMMEKLPHNSLGWLLIDEAGQAVPQAAVGGIMRAKRTLIVGDPQQIEPVFTTPAKLVDFLCEPLLQEETKKWVPHRVSVQAVADRANPYGCLLDIMEAKQWIGIPLWVHRRCIEPMFSIANEIAYKSRMKHGKDAQYIVQTEHALLGQNRWIDVAGVCTHKQYNPQQQVVLFELLKTLQNAKNDFNDVYVITPFRAVKQMLREEFRIHKHELMGTINLKPQEYWTWCRKNLGTVHTFQGKENATVILVLGCDRQNRGGAIWASSKPNLLNVVVTRAQSNIYFIGDTDVWSELNFYRNVFAHINADAQFDNLK